MCRICTLNEITKFDEPSKLSDEALLFQIELIEQNISTLKAATLNIIQMMFEVAETPIERLVAEDKFRAIADAQHPSDIYPPYVEFTSVAFMRGLVDTLV